MSAEPRHTLGWKWSQATTAPHRHGSRLSFFLAGLFVLTLTQLAPVAAGQAAPANDNFTNAIQLVGTNIMVAGTNINATKEPGEPDHAGGSGGKSVWWYWQAPDVGYVTISTAGSFSTLYPLSLEPLDTLLGVYTGSAVADLTEIASDDDGPVDVTSLVRFKTSAGAVYRIAVDGYSYDTPADADSGIILLSLQFAPGLPVASPWVLPAIDGTTIGSTNFNGKVVVLNFWATWCQPCVDEIPDLISLQQKYAPDGLTVIGLSVDDSSDGVTPPISLVGSFAASYGINYPVVMDRPVGSVVETLYGGIQYIPSTFIIDRQNHIAQTFVGTQTYGTFENAVLPLLYANLTIKVTVAHGQAHISWPATQAAFVVQSTGDLASGAWNQANALVQSDGVNQFVDLPAGPAPQFFRLRHQ